jgi:hypothetical protein
LRSACRYRNIRAGFDNNPTDYLSEHSIRHAFHHNAFLVVSNGERVCDYVWRWLQFPAFAAMP